MKIIGALCIIACLFFLLLAHAEERVELSQASPTQAVIRESPKYRDKIYWPMMPGESLAQLAITLYPNNPILQERFIKKTLSLSRSLEAPVYPKQKFSKPRLLIIPNDKAIKDMTHRIKKPEELTLEALKQQELKQEIQQLRLSYQLNTRAVAASTPTMPIAEVIKPVAKLQRQGQRAEAIDVYESPIPMTAVPQSPKPQIAQQASAISPTASVPSNATHQLQTSSEPAKPSGLALIDVARPIFEWPNIRLPTVHWHGLWQTTLKPIAHGYDIVANAVKRLNQQALLLRHEYASKHFTQVLDDYRLRNIVLISMLGALFLLIGILHRRRARKQGEMLSVIKDTISHDAEFTIEIPTAVQEHPLPVDSHQTEQADVLETPAYEQRGNH